MSQGPTTPPAAPQPIEMSLSERLRLYGSLAVLVLLVLFCLQNLQEAQLRFLWFEWETRVIWALILSATFGAVATFSIMTIRSMQARRQAAAMQRRARDA